jgi:prevent-host-death family protein
MVVPARELKNRLGKYLQRVRGGESVVITDRGVPIAELRPLTEDHLSPEQRLERMADAGDLTLPGAGKRLARPRLLTVRGKLLSTSLLEDRE